MKVFELYGDRIGAYHPEYESVKDTEGRYTDEIRFVETPDWVWEGYGYDETKEGDERFIKPALPEGWEYDENNNPWDPESFRVTERSQMHDATTGDTMEALRKIREGDTTHDWNAWLDLLDQYNRDITATKSQEGYPHMVTYPPYPTKPWEKRDDIIKNTGDNHI